MTAMTTQPVHPGRDDQEDVVLLPFATEHLLSLIHI